MEKLNFKTLSDKQFTSYQDNNIAIFKGFGEISVIPSGNIMLEGFLLVFVLKGNAEFSVDGKQYSPQANDMFMCQPRHILKRAMISVDFEVIAFIVNPDYTEKLLKKMRIDWTILRMKLITSHEIFHCEPCDIARISMYKKIIQDKLEAPVSCNRQHSIDMLVCSMIYDLIDICAKSNEHPDIQLGPSKENIIDRFFKILQNSSEPFTNVNGYADKLNISSKYFSTLCKDATGKTASQLINDEIIHSAQLLLKDNEYSIKQIAEKLGFANQSHFGVFFHRHTGVSPQRYRMGE